MKNRSSKIFSHGLALLVVLTMVFQVISVVADSPGFQHNFYGTLTINGEAAQAGTEVKVYIDGADRTYEPYETTQEGLYGSNQFGATKLKATGTDDDFGSDVVFMVESSPGSGVFVEADQMGSFNPGANTELDLTVQTVGCDQYATFEDCSDNVLCEWCTECDGSFWSGFADRCVEAGSCVQDTCSVQECSAQCDDTTPCPDTDCGDFDGCVDNIYRTYSSVANTCDSCACSTNECTIFVEEADTDSDGYSETCGDCAADDADMFPGNPESCDNKDNDCDQLVDEDFPNLEDVCSVGVGACETNGNLICNVEGTGVVCDAVPGVPGTEDCQDGIDNDCDGDVDQDDTQCQECTSGATQSCNLQVGVCSGAEETCDGGFWSGCDYLAHDAAFEAAEESCNDLLDNDCDGLTDCSDVSCSADPVCLPESVCDDQTDNDQDGDVDCDDSDCAADSACIATYCIEVDSIRLLDHNEDPISAIAPGAWYYIEVTNSNVCDEDIEVMQIIQVVDAGVTPFGIAAVTSDILAGDSSTVSAQFEMTGSAGAYTAQAFNWNDWSSQSGWTELSLPDSLGFTVE